jgi:hypothetical protein
MDSSSHEIGRFVYEKYIKKKFVKDSALPDPLTAHKQGSKLQSIAQ